MKIFNVRRLAVCKESRGVINEIHLKGYTEKPMRVPPINDNLYDGVHCDVVIVARIVGWQSRGNFPIQS
jgi:hypothetical protein